MKEGQGHSFLRSQELLGQSFGLINQMNSEVPQDNEMNVGKEGCVLEAKRPLLLWGHNQCLGNKEEVW